MAYYAYHLCDGRNEFSTILKSQHLFQQFLVDTYCKIERERLLYLRQNKNRLRAAEYTSVKEYLDDLSVAVDEGGNWRAGRLFVLPTTFLEGDRYVRVQMFDINAISIRGGHPGILLTMICNPKWKEITEVLLPGQSAQDRTDICTRFFWLKIEELTHGEQRSAIW